jgi:hypothetical protein
MAKLYALIVFGHYALEYYLTNLLELRMFKKTKAKSSQIKYT